MAKLIEVKVKPNSGRSEIVGDIVYLKGSPEYGKANTELIKLFSKKGLDVKIVRGKTGRRKVLRVK